MSAVLSRTGWLVRLPVRSPGMAAIPRIQVHRAAVAVAVASALLAIEASPAAASAPAAACQEYVVCGQPSGESSGTNAVAPAPGPRHGRRPPPGPRPSVASRTDLPLTSYPLTPAILIPGVVLVAGLAAAVALGLGRRERGGVATS